MKYIVKYKITSLLLGIVLSIPIVLLLSCDDGYNYTGPWVEVYVENLQGRLYSVWFNSPDDGWTCGSGGEIGFQFVLYHWNGTYWEHYPYGGWFDNVDFYDIVLGNVMFTSPDDGWLTGRVMMDRHNKDGFGIILHYDGDEWSVFERDFGYSGGTVFALAPDDVWFASYRSSGQGTWFFHWDGVSLEHISSPYVAGISDMWFLNSNDGWAVGHSELALHWDGIEWDVVHSFGGSEEAFEAVWGTAMDDVWVGGTGFYGNHGLWHWDGSEFDIYEPMYDRVYNIHDIHFSSPDEGWIATTNQEHRLWHWNGVEWEAVDIHPNYLGFGIFSIDGTNAWMVGYRPTGDIGPRITSWHYEP